ncbi:MAG: DUF4040 domain-containing protein [Caldilineaceae bacterium]|nr:DUF4040 domain-containing protein [Caldilineaceae bacterium]MBP8109873.1 DUF4040 domain-containing protein [Caldilineaceae bacterium]MBP8122503.1 DUF4040 domain-containing protein [Caldilineaceae bacterium]MBP9072956.1 DUF4040 domain-containing protein [Caldilineaceae bacterium]
MLALALILLFATSLFLWLIRPHRLALGGWVAALPPAAIAAWLISQIPSLNAGKTLTEVYAWIPSFGLDISLRLDGLGLLFGLIITVIGAAIAFYTHYYLANDESQGLFYAYLFAFMASMLGIVWSDNVIALFVFWEGTSLTSYLLIGFKHKESQAQTGANTALVITGFGGIFMLMGLLLLGQAVGSFRISEILAISQLTSLPIFPAALALILLGAFTKSAQFPFHFWLPGAMSAPTPASAYLHSATMVKAGVFLLARFHPAMSDSPIWFWSLLSVGGITALVGAITAIAKWDLKATLAYATVSQLGILVLLLAFDNEYAYTAVVVGIVAHALYKGPFFMVAGNIDHATHSRDIRELAGLWRKLPWTATTAILAGLSMAGLPPLFGFLAKETLLETLFHQLESSHDSLWWIAIGLAGVIGAFFVAYSLTLLWEPFLRRTSPHETAQVVHPAPFALDAPALFLVLLGTAMPFGLGSFVPHLLNPAASAVAGETLHIELALWHGLTPVFLTSMAAIATGILLFLGRSWVRKAIQATPSWLDGQDLFKERVIGGIYGGARWVTQAVQGRTLADHASIVLMSAVGMVVYALVVGLESWAGLGTLFLPWQLLRESMPEFQEVALFAVAIIAALVTVQSQPRLNAIISLGVVGIVVTLAFVFFGAPDLALTQLLIEVLTVVLLVLVFYRIPIQFRHPLHWLVLLRNLFVSVCVGLLGFVLVVLTVGKPLAPSISDFFMRNSVLSGHGANVVNVILVDFRGYDTMGEITVLSLAALGGYALLRSSRLRQTGKGKEDNEGEGVSG